MQTSVPLQPDHAVQLVQQKSRVRGLDNHLVNQLGKDEGKKMNSNYQEATEADKNVFLLSFFVSLVNFKYDECYQ